MRTLLLRNPLSIWLRWWFKTAYLKLRYINRHLVIGYLADVIHCRFGKYNTIYDNCFLWDVELGDCSYVGANTRLVKTKVGKFTAISDNVECGLGMHPTGPFVSVHPAFYSTRKQAQITFADRDYFEEYREVEIGNDVWIGANVIVLGGIKIGDGAIVGAGAVLTRDVPPYAVVGGVPAEVIKYRFEEPDINFLLDFKWWDKDIDWLRRNYKDFHDISKIKKRPNI